MEDSMVGAHKDNLVFKGRSENVEDINSSCKLDEIKLPLLTSYNNAPGNSILRALESRENHEEQECVEGKSWRSHRCLVRAVRPKSQSTKHSERTLFLPFA